VGKEKKSNAKKEIKERREEISQVERPPLSRKGEKRLGRQKLARVSLRAALATNFICRRVKQERPASGDESMGWSI